MKRCASAVLVIRLVVALWVLAWVSARPAAGQAQSASPADIDALLTTYARDHDFHGVVRIERPGTMVVERAFGTADRTWDIPMTADVRFRVASITKLFTATLVLQLVESGAWSLDDPIGRRVAECTGERGEHVTLRHLLSHTSGLPNMDTVRSYEEAVTRGMPLYQLPHSVPALVAQFCAGVADRRPGAAFSYNNIDYILLGLAVERQAKTSFDDVLSRRILVPVGMTDAGLIRQAAILPRLAPTYFRPAPGQTLANDLPVFMENWWTAGGMYATAADVARFANALYSGKLLQPASLAQLLTPGLDRYGFGLWVFSREAGGRTHRLAQRPGSVMGANTMLLRILDTNTTIVILSNTNLTDIDAFSFVLADRLDD